MVHKVFVQQIQSPFLLIGKVPHCQLLVSFFYRIVFGIGPETFDVLIGDIIVDVELCRHYAQEVGFLVQLGSVGGKAFEVVIPQGGICFIDLCHYISPQRDKFSPVVMDKFLFYFWILRFSVTVVIDVRHFL